MSSDFNADPNLLARFREEVDTYLLILQQDLISLEHDKDNPELLREIMRAAHTIKGNAQMMGFRQIARIMHSLEDITAAMRNREMEVDQQVNDLLFEAIDMVDILTKAQLSRQEIPIDPEELIARLEQLKPKSATPSQPHDNGAEADATSPTTANPPTTSPTTETAGSAIVSVQDQSVRVRIERLDALMSLSGEMVISQMQSERGMEGVRGLLGAMRLRSQQVNGLRDRVEREWGNISQEDLQRELDQVIEFDEALQGMNSDSLAVLEEFNANLNAITDELQDTVLNLRMLPIETIYSQFARTVRDLARERGKQVNFFPIGGETEVDKRVLEGLNEALIHLVRNALDHGIEPPEQRIKGGKIPIGQIIIRATSRGGQVVVEVSDDGAGIDPERLKAVAAQRGIISAVEAAKMNPADAMQLVFYSGFSTATLITDTSGRGVGMEIVRNVVSRLGGSLELQSEVGRGTTITLRLPITLSAIRALLVRTRGQVFALATNAVESMLYIGLEDIMAMEGREAIVVGARTVPLLRLDETLGLHRGEQATNINRQMVGMNTGLRLPDFNAKAELEDGSAASAIRAQIAQLEVGGPNDWSTPHSNGKLHLNLDSRLGGQFYEPGVAIQLEGKLPVVVLRGSERQVAMLVDELVDEREIVVKRLSPIIAEAEPVAGTTVMGDGSIVIILDGPALLDLARNTMSGRRGDELGVAADWREQLSRPRTPILVVDDSVTTRELERSILEAANYKVDIAVDGVEALAMLEHNRYALVIADIEMPRMDGFTLTERIKADPKLRNLPVIIVSSLVNEEYQRRGIEVGAQAYITKGQFDQNNLLDTIELLVGRAQAAEV